MKIEKIKLDIKATVNETNRMHSNFNKHSVINMGKHWNVLGKGKLLIKKRKIWMEAMNTRDTFGDAQRKCNQILKIIQALNKT